MQLLDQDTRCIIVNSPPGAGKSTLVRECAAHLARSGKQVPIITQTNDQADDHVQRLRTSSDTAGLRIGRLHGRDYNTTRHQDTSPDLARLLECDIIVAPAAKWGTLNRRAVPEWQPEVGIIDEGYQMSSGDLSKVAGRLPRLLVVGDPGQLSPFTTADDSTLRSAAAWPLDTAARTIQINHPGTPTVTLPVTWRLPTTTAQLISDSFYRDKFTAGSDPQQRLLHLPLGVVRDGYDRAIRMAASHSICLLELPDEHVAVTDPDTITAISELVARLLTSRITRIDNDRSEPLRAHDIAIGVTHTHQRERLQAAVDRKIATLGEAPGAVHVDTANRLQGREFEVVIAWHPLSGRRDATAFHLEAGRLCVLASRHKRACIVVAREGIQRQLEAYPHTEPVWLSAPKAPVDGWTANLRFLEGIREIANVKLDSSVVIPGPRQP
ncbi:AAA domain-containing protein [Actinoplanes philippinensis]|uniref:AAA domain-containing protein n=1 Tax=Actinoplanes philippinensis TaxID=35752 RepID=UPI0033D116F1